MALRKALVAAVTWSLLWDRVIALRRPDGRLNANLPPIPTVPIVGVQDNVAVTSRNGTELASYDTTYYFEQLIDHSNPSLGTFSQRYWFTSEYYEPGGPIILFTPGEANAAPYTGYLTNSTINGQIAQQSSGAATVLEHRFYGFSNPFNNLSVESLRLHTIEQAVQDLVYFAENANLPMSGGDSVKPGEAPWILVGGSYSGALTSWTMVNQPDVFWAGYASSAVVEAILDYWGYFEPIRQYMPQNCSADVEAVITHVDQVFTNGTEAEIAALKSNWGLGDMTHLDDAAGALRNNLWDWQSLQPDAGNDTMFFAFCDALEVIDRVSAPAEGWGLDHALQAWGAFWNDTYYAYVCGDEDAENCLGTYDTSQSYWTNITVDNAGRSWEWIVCNEVGFLQDGAPEDWPTLVSRLIQPTYDERQCQQMFPQAFGTWPVANVNATNEAYDGWDVQIDRLFFANGQRDPWREATVSADNHNVSSTPTQPIAIGNGYHCSDLLTPNAEVDETVRAVQQEALEYMKTWLAEWTPGTSRKTRREEERRLINSRITGGRLSA